MPSLLRNYKGITALAGLLTAGISASGQSGVNPQGSEYPAAGVLRGDQVQPSISVNAAGGYVVWQDNITDGLGSGISARRLSADGLGRLSNFRVNLSGEGDQENPRVQVLPDGGAVFVWQGGNSVNSDIFARFVDSNGIFKTGDLLINSHTAGVQANPSVAALSNGEVVVIWASHDQDGSMQGVYGQRLSSSGAKIGGEFQINQFTAYNQRHPVVAALGDGGFAVSWVSEQQRFERSVDIFARVFTGSRTEVGKEFLVNSSTNLCANPVVALTSENKLAFAWSQRDIGSTESQWEIYGRIIDLTGKATSAAQKINAHPRGNHLDPQIVSDGDQMLAVWTSIGQDGSDEGIFGRLLEANGVAAGDEFKINDYSFSRQFHPAVASVDKGSFIVTWSSFIGGATSFDIFAQRYASSGIKPAAPFVAPLSSSRIAVTWPIHGDSRIIGYEIFVDGGDQPVSSTEGIWMAENLAPASKHTFRLAYKLNGGGRSPLSEASEATTWSSDENFDGLPDDWQVQYWGANPDAWPDSRIDTDGDGATNAQEFMAGTNPTEASSVLKTNIRSSDQGSFLEWNTQPGFVYQVQTKPDVVGHWIDLGLPRLAVGERDSMLIEGSNDPVYYRIKRLR